MGLFSKKEVRTEERIENIYLPSMSVFSSFNTNQNNIIANQCRNIISNAIATLPINVFFERNDGSKNKAFEHPLYSILKYEPNLDEVPFVFYSTLLNNLLDYGNAYLYKDIKGDKITALYNLVSKNMEVKRDNINRKIYIYNGKELPRENVLHIVGLEYDGLVGKGIRDIGKQQLEIAQKMDDFAGEAFQSQITKRMIIDISKMFPDAKPEDVKNIAEYVRKNYADNNKPFITFNGMEVKNQETNDNRTNNLVQNREYQQKLIASLYNVPVSMLTQSAVNVSLEIQNTLFLTYTLLPWIKIVEQHLKKLFTPYERERYFVEFNVAGLLRADFKSRMESYSVGLMNGIYTPNQIAKLENLPLVENEAYNTKFIQSNLMPLTDEVINSYMASAKLKMKELEDKDTTGIGDDKK